MVLIVTVTISGRIVLSDEESPSHWQQNDYKGFPPSVDWDTVDFKSSNAIQELPVISAICDPVNKQKVKLQNGKLVVRGKKMKTHLLVTVELSVAMAELFWNVLLLDRICLVRRWVQDMARGRIRRQRAEMAACGDHKTGQG